MANKSLFNCDCVIDEMTMPTDTVNALCPFPLDHKPFTCPFIFVTVFLHLSWQEIKEYCISGCKLFSALIQEERCLICVLVSSLLCTCSFQISFQISYLLTSLESLLTSITYERLHVILRKFFSLLVRFLFVWLSALSLILWMLCTAPEHLAVLVSLECPKCLCAVCWRSEEPWKFNSLQRVSNFACVYCNCAGKS